MKCETRYGKPNNPVSSLTVNHKSMTCTVDGRVNQFSHEFTEVFWDFYTYQLETFAFKVLPATGAGNYITAFAVGFRRDDWCTTIQTHACSWLQWTGNRVLKPAFHLLFPGGMVD
ncbi:MAG: hypothetical protein NWF13_01260 [Candidatus Bathyarchaeota archaeon]|nr:hypothetical protein [Candidatus Bathyarchaeota archaeon]